MHVDRHLIEERAALTEFFYWSTHVYDPAQSFDIPLPELCTLLGDAIANMNSTLGRIDKIGKDI
jgi:hypothetical protein